MTKRLRRAETASRVYEGGRYHYRFRCPECGQMRMFLAGISVTPENSPECEPRARFAMHCGFCGAHRDVAHLPLSEALQRTDEDF